MQLSTHCKLIVFICASLSLFACATPQFEADVVRFHALEPEFVAGGQRVAILPGQTEEEGLEFASYAQLIGAALTDIGFQSALDGQTDFILEVTTNVREIRPLQTGRSPGSVSVGVGGVGGNVGVGVGTSVGIGGRSEQIMYAKELKVRMLKSTSNKTVFEGRAITQEESDLLAEAMPYLVRAIFAEFPGENGQTTTYVEALE